MRHCSIWDQCLDDNGYTAFELILFDRHFTPLKYTVLGVALQTVPVFNDQ